MVRLTHAHAVDTRPFSQGPRREGPGDEANPEICMFLVIEVGTVKYSANFSVVKMVQLSINFTLAFSPYLSNAVG